MKKKWFKVEENGETYATVKAFDVDDALEKAYDDELPGSLILITVYQHNGIGWKKQWEGKIETP